MKKEKLQPTTVLNKTRREKKKKSLLWTMERKDKGKLNQILRGKSHGLLFVRVRP